MSFCDLMRVQAKAALRFGDERGCWYSLLASVWEGLDPLKDQVKHGA